MQLFTETPDAARSFPFFTADDEESSASNVRRWTKSEYYKMAELGFFDGMKVELIEGEIIVNADYEIVSRKHEVFMVMNSPHAVAIRLLVEALRKIFKEGFLVDSQLPLDFGASEPEPDLAVVEGGARDFIKSHPKAALLIVEVSDATLRFDRIKKSSLYAARGIQDYWIVNLKKKRIEVYRRPMTDETAFYGHAYAEAALYTENDTISPLAKPESKIKISDLLP